MVSPELRGAGPVDFSLPDRGHQSAVANGLPKGAHGRTATSL